LYLTAVQAANWRSDPIDVTPQASASANVVCCRAGARSEKPLPASDLSRAARSLAAWARKMRPPLRFPPPGGAADVRPASRVPGRPGYAGTAMCLCRYKLLEHFDWEAVSHQDRLGAAVRGACQEPKRALLTRPPVAL
jgi:hypothetical protein